MNHSMLGTTACHQSTLDGERTETIVGHCVNVRHLGKLAFFTLRSQTSNLQVVCTAKGVIDALRIVDDFALVEVSGVIQRKRRRHEHDPLEHELNATTLRQVVSNATRAAEIAGRRLGHLCITRHRRRGLTLVGNAEPAAMAADKVWPSRR